MTAFSMALPDTVFWHSGHRKAALLDRMFFEQQAPSNDAFYGAYLDLILQGLRR